MSTDRDYYRILHVQRDAPTEIIQASYRTLMQRLRHHPDLGGDHEHAVLLNEALAVLTDAARRSEYDLQREIAAARRANQPAADSTATIDETSELFAAMRCLFCAAPHGLERAVERDDECGHCASPLFPAERQRLEYSGQRMLSRVPQQRAVRLYTKWPQAEAWTAEMRDVSLNGMKIATLLELAHNQVVKIDCEICQSLARVAHCRPDPRSAELWLIGLEFVTLRFTRSRGSFVSAYA